MVVVRRGPRSMADPATGGTKLPVKTKMYGGRVPIQEMPESDCDFSALGMQWQGAAAVVDNAVVLQMIRMCTN